jgi:hypothetical protein
MESLMRQCVPIPKFIIFPRQAGGYSRKLTILPFCVVLWIRLLAPSIACAAFEEIPAGARSAGLGSSGVAINGPEAMFCHPAGMAASGSPAVFVFTARPFGLKELAYHSACAVIPTRLGNFGLGCLTNGQALYRETTLAVGWAGRLGTRLSFGIVFRGLNLRIQKYGSWNGLALDAGMRILLGEKWQFGFSNTNLNRVELPSSKSPFPQTTRIGLVHVPSKNLIFTIEMDKDVRFEPEFRGGMECSPVSFLNIRCGFGRNPSHFSSGLGLTWKQFAFDYALSMHPVLGTTHQGALTVSFERGSKNQ